MELFSKDFIFGNFRASDYGLILVSFTSSSDAEVNFGQKFDEKLTPTLTLVKDPSMYGDNTHFTEKELRSIFRILTGTKEYQWLKLINHEMDEDLWYRAKTSNVSYKKLGGRVVGIILELECDSAFAWSGEYVISINAKAYRSFYIYNHTDDFLNYTLPLVEIASSSAGNITITNDSDNRWRSEFKNVSANETLILDSRREIITSNAVHTSLLNDFNLHWPRLVPGKNEYVTDKDASLTFKFRVPRKVGFTE